MAHYCGYVLNPGPKWMKLNVDATFSLSNPVPMNVINFDVTFTKQNPLWNGRAQLFCAVIPSVNCKKLNQQIHYKSIQLQLHSKEILEDLPRGLFSFL